MLIVSLIQFAAVAEDSVENFCGIYRSAWLKNHFLFASPNIAVSKFKIPLQSSHRRFGAAKKVVAWLQFIHLFIPAELRRA